MSMFVVHGRDGTKIESLVASSLQAKPRDSSNATTSNCQVGLVVGVQVPSWLRIQFPERFLFLGLVVLLVKQQPRSQVVS